MFVTLPCRFSNVIDFVDVVMKLTWNELKISVMLSGKNIKSENKYENIE